MNIRKGFNEKNYYFWDRIYLSVLLVLAVFLTILMNYEIFIFIRCLLGLTSSNINAILAILYDNIFVYMFTVALFLISSLLLRYLCILICIYFSIKNKTRLFLSFIYLFVVLHNSTSAALCVYFSECSWIYSMFHFVIETFFVYIIYISMCVDSELNKMKFLYQHQSSPLKCIRLIYPSIASYTKEISLMAIIVLFDAYAFCKSVLNINLLPQCISYLFDTSEIVGTSHLEFFVGIIAMQIILLVFTYIYLKLEV